MGAVKRAVGFLLIIVGIVASFFWAFQEGAHYETAEGAAGLGGDLVEQGKKLWELEPGFAMHALLSQVLTLAVGAMGCFLLLRRQEES